MSCAVEFAVVVRVGAACGPRMPSMPTADPRRWQPGHVSSSYFHQHNDHYLLLVVTLCPSSSQRIISTTSLFTEAFIIHNFSFHPLLSFPIDLSHLSTYTQRAPT